MQRLKLGSWILAAIPNVLSLARLALGLAFPWLPVSWRLAVMAVAAVTDLLDGAASRHWGATSDVGRFLDPAADKVFVLAVLGTLIAEDALQLWEATLLGLRDIIVLLGLGWILLVGSGASNRQIAPTLLGKATTAGQFLALATLFFNREWWLFVFVPAVILSSLAAADYLWLFLRRSPSSPSRPLSPSPPHASPSSSK